MSDLYSVPAGGDVAEGLPQVNLPSAGAPPPQAGPLRLTVHPSPQAKADPWGGFSSEPPQADPAANVDPWAHFSDAPPAAETKTAPRTVGAVASGAAGLADGLSFGAAPALAGLTAATAGKSEMPGDELAKMILPEPVHGALRLLHEHFSDHPDPAVSDAYERGRKAQLEEQDLASEQHPAAFLGGQLAGALAVPMPGASVVEGASALGKVGRGILAGTEGGAAYGAGDAISNDKSAGDVAMAGVKGAATGAAFGGLGSGVIEVGGKVANRVGSIVRGARDVDAEAGKTIVDAVGRDFQRSGPNLTPEQIAAGNAAGTPRAILDTGGERTRLLARSATNNSAEAHAAINDLTRDRFETQAPRVAQFIRGLTGGGNAADDMASLDRAARAANKPAYQRAYAAGDRPLWSPELERLSTSHSVPKAIEGAIVRGKDRAVGDGFGGFNPKISVTPDGRIIHNKGANGVPTYPNLQFWDYVQREMKDAASAAQRSGNNEQANAIGTVHGQLKSELDRLVPEFKHARSTAAAFFGADNALEAGQKFVMSNASIPEARTALQGMTKAERELFARGFASDLADKISRTGDNRSVLNSIFLNNEPARQKIVMALGANRARHLEALLRVESLIDEGRKALGNSTTARQLKSLGMAAGHGVAGAGAVGAFEAFHEHDFNPLHIIVAALTFGAIKRGAHVVDEKVAHRIGEMLASNDPAILSKGVQVVASRPVLFDAIRRATSAGARVGAHDIGPARAVAGAGAVAQSLMSEGDPHDTENPFDNSSQ